MRYLIGIGNYLARDDSVGLRVAEAIAERGLDEGFEAIDLGGTLLDLLHYLGEDVERVLVVDATEMGVGPGEYRLFTRDDVRSTKSLAGVSTHEGDVIKMLDLAASLGRHLPPVTILGIQPAETGEGEGLSEPVAGRFEEYVAEAIRAITRA